MDQCIGCQRGLHCPEDVVRNPQMGAPAPPISPGSRTARPPVFQPSRTLPLDAEREESHAPPTEAPSICGWSMEDPSPCPVAERAILNTEIPTPRHSTGLTRLLPMSCSHQLEGVATWSR